MTVPLELLKQWQEQTAQLDSEFRGLQDGWNKFFDDQIEDTNKYRGKSKTYKKKLRGMENHSMLLIRDQKELEKSLHDITREHD